MIPDLTMVQSPEPSSPEFPQLSRSQLSHLDERHPRNSLPHNRIDSAEIPHVERAATLPSSIQTDGPTFISPQDFVEMRKSHTSEELLLLDLRVFAQYSKSRIQGALNLCIPTTLLKRPSYNVQRLAETFQYKKDDRAKFKRWRETKVIVVYDSSSLTLDEAISCSNILKKFASEGYSGSTYILNGGFNSLLRKFPNEVDSIEGANSKKLSLDTPSAPIAGGCDMPASQNGANPFFGTIRQNMDLIDGVGQIPLKRPASFANDERLAKLPKWLRDASDPKNEGKAIADRFLDIEKAEQKRMQKALTKVSWEDPMSPNNVQMAGIEKGAKNRYKDILPFDHSRVKLRESSSDGCDYINASHIRSKQNSRQYIACQAPVPATFKDFWRVVWEQEARIIVMLTAESEGGQLKSHPYWLPGDYGPFKVQIIEESSQPLGESLHPKPQKSHTLPLGTPRPKGLSPPNRQNSAQLGTSPSFFGFKPPSNSPAPTPGGSSTPSDRHNATVRTLIITHSGLPFAPIRQITQIHCSTWPDFGIPAHPRDLLALIELCSSHRQDGGQPVVVHCSAGCGRTGVFCTVDTVLDLLGRKGYWARERGREDEDEGGADLVAETVAGFRLQRLSMVQTLRQFVLCYETVMEAFAARGV